VNKDDRQLHERDSYKEGMGGALHQVPMARIHSPAKLDVLGHEVASKQQVRALIRSRPNFGGKHEADR